ncbi:MAG: family phosphohydrolase, histidinol phosphatase [Verrucomicrobiaceae bacterium]|nr:family phosphohydrolase, histidinol phosphatase [Verrucomicrobiaceae bacterium]
MVSRRHATLLKRRAVYGKVAFMMEMPCRHRPSLSMIRRIFCSALFITLTASAEPLHWYKGNTHTHTLWSDGNDFPDMVTDWYRTHGYNFLGLSDHNILQAKEVWMAEAAVEKRRKALGKTTMEKYRTRFGSPWVEERETDGQMEVRLKKLEEYRPLFEKSGEFLLVQAEEISAQFQKSPIHIGAVNVAEVITPITGSSIADVIRANLRAVMDQEQRLGRPMITHVNHPNFRWSLTAEDMAQVAEEKFFEVYNGHPSIHHLGDADRVGDEAIWDIANTLRLTQFKTPPLMGVATDDSHHYHGEDGSPGRGWIMVQAEKLEAGALIGAMRAGRFYASSGATLDEIEFHDGTLHLRIHEEPGVTYATRIVGTPKDYDASTTEAPMPADDFHKTRTRYSSDVGKTFATAAGPEVQYKLTGKELYIRAVITSSKPHPNPSFAGQTEEAWTQPVGWELH